MKQENIADIYALTRSSKESALIACTPLNQGVHRTMQLECESSNVPVFERAWQYIVDQHPSVRTACFGKILTSRSRWFSVRLGSQPVYKPNQAGTISLGWAYKGE